MPKFSKDPLESPGVPEQGSDQSKTSRADDAVLTLDDQVLSASAHIDQARARSQDPAQKPPTEPMSMAFSAAVEKQLRSLQGRFLEIASFAAVLGVLRGSLPPWISSVRLERRGELVHLMLFCEQHPPEVEVSALRARLKQFIVKHPTAVDLVRTGSGGGTQLSMVVVPPNDTETDEMSSVITLLEHPDSTNPLELPPSTKKKSFNSAAFQLEARRTLPAGARLWKNSLYEIPGSKKKGDFVFSTMRIFVPEELSTEVEEWRNRLEEKYRIGILILKEQTSASIGKQLQNIADEDGILRSPEKAAGLITRIHGAVPKFNILSLPHIHFPADARDMTDRPAISIDPAGSMDLDDLIDAAILPSGGYRIWVYFADVTHVIKPGDPFDRYASKVGFSLYGRHRSVPLLGPDLGFHRLSLLPEEERLAWCVRLDLDPTGKVAERDFFRAVVKSHKRYTFDELHPSVLQSSGGIPAQLRTAYEAAALLRSRRLKHAGFVKYKEEGNSYVVIEELMLASKAAIASICERAKVPILYRVHTPPGRTIRKEILVKLREANLKVELRDLNDPQRFRTLLGELQNRGEMGLLHYVLDSYLQRARYDVVNRGHHGLGLSAYTETKALRNYAGLLNQRQFAHQLSDEPGMSEVELKRWQARVNRQRRIYQEKLVRLLTFEGLHERLSDVGRVFDAAIVAQKPYGKLVRVPGFDAWGLIEEKNFWQQAPIPDFDEALSEPPSPENLMHVQVKLDGFSPEYRRYLFTLVRS